MPKIIRSSDVPDRLYERLKARAATAGVPLGDYPRLELERVGEQLTPDALRDALARLDPVVTDESAAGAVRAERDAR